MRKIMRTAVAYTAIGSFAILMGAAGMGCGETVVQPATTTEKSSHESTTTNSTGFVPSSSSSTTTQKSTSTNSN